MSKTGWLLVLINALLAVIANLMLRSGVEKAGGLDQGISGFVNLAKQPLFDFGIVLYALATLVWIRVLSVEPLSVAYPVLVSITFLLVTMGAALLFCESLSWHKILGLMVILAGILIVSRS
jgi:multidrug transporter EmrE-like cation transporter